MSSVGRRGWTVRGALARRLCHASARAPLLALALAVAVAVPAGAGVAHAGQPGIHHVPPIEAAGGEPLLLEVTADSALLVANVELRWRTVGDKDWHSTRLQLTPKGAWVATLPASDVRPPGVEYFLVAVDGAEPGPRFASDRDPQRVVVVGSAAQLQRAIELFRHDFLRSEARVDVDQRWFGETGGAHDDLWVGRVSYTYHVFRNVRDVEFALTRMRADSWRPTRKTPDEVYPVNGVGYDGGSAAVSIAPVLALGVRAELRLGADPEGVTAGGDCEFRIGLEPGTHFTAHVGGIGRVGYETGVALHWATVPRIPMAAVFDVTTWPIHADPAVHARFEASPSLGERAQLDVRLGYQARRADLGGVALGGALRWKW